MGNQTCCTLMDNENSNKLKKYSSKEMFITNLNTFHKDYIMVKGFNFESFSAIYTLVKNIHTNELHMLKRMSKTNNDSLYAMIRQYQQLDHPSIPKLLHVYESDEYYDLVLQTFNSFTVLSNYEYFREPNILKDDSILGFSPSHRRWPKPTMSDAQKRKVVYQLLDLVVYLKLHDLQHRSLFPNQIIVDQDFNVQSLAFEDSKPFGEFVEREYILSNLIYRSPQQLIKDSNNSVDVWAIGIILYQLVYNQHPYKYDSSQTSQLYESIINNTVLTPALVNKDPVVDLLINSMLTYDPLERYDAITLMEHPYFKTVYNNYEYIATHPIIINLTNYIRIKHRVCNKIIYLSGLYNENEFKRIFSMLDSNNKGYLNKNDVVKVIKYIYDEESKYNSKTDTIMQNNDKIYFNDFVVMGIEFNKEMLYKLLKFINKDNIYNNGEFKLIDYIEYHKVNAKNKLELDTIIFDNLATDLLESQSIENRLISILDFIDMLDDNLFQTEWYSFLKKAVYHERTIDQIEYFMQILEESVCNQRISTKGFKKQSFDEKNNKAFKIRRTTYSITLKVNSLAQLVQESQSHSSSDGNNHFSKNTINSNYNMSINANSIKSEGMSDYESQTNILLRKSKNMLHVNNESYEILKFGTSKSDKKLKFDVHEADAEDIMYYYLYLHRKTDPELKSESKILFNIREEDESLIKMKNNMKHNSLDNLFEDYKDGNREFILNQYYNQYSSV